ncbi:MAG: HPP family protein [Nanoarchaeota archaeon]
MVKVKTFLRHKRKLWHYHFIPSLIAGLIVALISYVYKLTAFNILLFASVGASAVILTNSRSHHLTKLRTTIIAYLLAVAISSIVYGLNLLIPIHVSINIFILIFLVGLFLFLFDAFHPPAITASLSFILLDRPLFDLIYLFIAIIVLLIIVRLITYVLSQHLPVKEFALEFKKRILPH